ncbi:hypothetical protein CLU79DRAFT_884011 [Phycomyces nitens]|nr:hypothetical protein CLU79DRAFT_884011 [Phycomyces nitens]
MSAHKLLFLSVFIVLILPGCYAPPIDDEESAAYQQGSHINMSKSYKILKTIVLGYLTHIMTIRPSPDTDQTHTLFWRIAYFVYPTMGICTAAEVILSSYEGEKIIGVDRYSGFFEERRRKELFRKGRGSWSPFRNWIYETWESFQKGCAELKKTIKKFFKPYDGISQETPVDNSKEISDLKAKLNAYDKDGQDEEVQKFPKDDENIAHLAAIFDTLEPRQARRVRNFILNGSLYLGFDLDPTEWYVHRNHALYTKDMTIAGSGAKRRYQISIKPYTVRYLTTKMLDELTSIQYLDTTSYTAICVTAGQLVYTIINCIDSEGDRWAKVIMLIYMIMSVLQTTSLIVLHKQPVAYSINLDGSIDIKEEPHRKDSGPEYDLDGDAGESIINIIPEHRATYKIEKEEDGVTYYTSDLLLKILGKQAFFRNPGYDAFIRHRGWAYILSGLGGLALPLLAGIWADYWAYTTTQWIVLGWIIGQLLFAPFSSTSPSSYSALLRLAFCFKVAATNHHAHRINGTHRAVLSTHGRFNGQRSMHRAHHPNLSMDPASAAWASTIHSPSILFNLGKLVPVNAVDDVLSDHIGQMTSLTLRYTRSKDFLAEALFTEPATRVKAISDGLVYQNTRIVASPSLPSNSYIVKVVQLLTYVSHRGTFRSKATVLLDTSGLDTPKYLPSRLHLEGSISCAVELRSKDIPPVCGYCREEGHFLRACTKRPSRTPRCKRCGVLGHEMASRDCSAHPNTVEAEHLQQEKLQLDISGPDVLCAGQAKVNALSSPSSVAVGSTLDNTPPYPIASAPKPIRHRFMLVMTTQSKAGSTQPPAPTGDNIVIPMYDPGGRGTAASKYSFAARGIALPNDGISRSIMADAEFRQSLLDLSI